MQFPAGPALGGLRVASPDDILRIGIVAACGFYYSPLFPWERPYHEKYPADTLLSYHREFADAIKNPETIVLVAIDQYDPDEGQQSETIILPDNGFQPPLRGEEVIVGVACWKLEASSKRVGQFQNDSGLYPDLPPNPSRDQNPDHVQRWSKLAHGAEQRHFQSTSTMEMVVVHPAYWRRGHGSTLVGWGMELANVDQVKQGVIAAKMGEKLYTGLGYSRLEELCLDGDEEAPDGVKCVAMEYTPQHDQRREDL